MIIKLTGAEIQSGLCRVKWAEGLILQLPYSHDGRNSWLLNYGVGEEAIRARKHRGLRFDEDTRAAEMIRSTEPLGNYVECDCSCATRCPQGRTGTRTKCRIWKEDGRHG